MQRIPFMYQDYLQFSEEQFIADEYFQQWVRFPDDDTVSFWEGFMAAYPEKRKSVLNAKAFLENLSFQNDLPSASQTEASLQNSLRRLEVMERAEASIVPESSRTRNLLTWAVAALLMAIAGFTIFEWTRPKGVTIEAVAEGKKIRTVMLPDSSLVTLNAGSHLTYSPHMLQAESREVWLDGEAFFDVKHLDRNGQPKRFIVHSGDMKIEVLGTSFNVKKLGDLTNVSLNTGRIRIALKDDPQTIMELQPGDFVRYSSKEKHFLKKQVKPELISVWKEEKLSLDNMTVSEIARLLEDAYGYSVRMEDSILSETKLSGSLQLKDEAAILESLAFSLDIDIIKKDRELYLQHKTKQ